MNRPQVLLLLAALASACGESSITVPADADLTGDIPASDASVATLGDARASEDRSSTNDVRAPLDAPSPDAPSPDVPSPDVPSPDVPSPDVPSPDVPSPDVPSPDAGAVDDGAVALPRSSFAQIYETILRPKCSGCHGPERVGSALIMGDVGSAYRALVNVPVASQWIRVCDYTRAQLGGVAYRVRPSDPAASMLHFLPQCYVRDAEHMRLTEGERAVIRGWIQRGAPETEF